MNRVVFIKNTVVKGFGRGSKELGCPTANVDHANELDLETGIYCGLAQLIIKSPKQIQLEPGCEADHDYQEIVDKLPFISEVRGMVCSYGFNPHYGNTEKSLEVHVLDDFKFNFYGAELRVLICKKMRDEEKYDSLEELKSAIANDIRNAKNEVQNYIHHASDSEYFVDRLNNNNYSQIEAE